MNFNEEFGVFRSQNIINNNKTFKTNNNKDSDNKSISTTDDNKNHKLNGNTSNIENPFLIKNNDFNGDYKENNSNIYNQTNKNGHKHNDMRNFVTYKNGQNSFNNKTKNDNSNCNNDDSNNSVLIKSKEKNYLMNKYQNFGIEDTDANNKGSNNIFQNKNNKNNEDDEEDEDDNENSSYYIKMMKRKQNRLKKQNKNCNYNDEEEVGNNVFKNNYKKNNYNKKKNNYDYNKEDEEVDNIQIKNNYNYKNKMNNANNRIIGDVSFQKASDFYGKKENNKEKNNSGDKLDEEIKKGRETFQKFVPPKAINPNISVGYKNIKSNDNFELKKDYTNHNSNTGMVGKSRPNNKNNGSDSEADEDPRIKGIDKKVSYFAIK